MRRSEREVRDFSAMCKILEGCDVLRLGFSEEGGAYIVPVNFGLFCRDGRLSLYFHGAAEGKKAELIKESGPKARAGARRDRMRLQLSLSKRYRKRTRRKHFGHGGKEKGTFVHYEALRTRARRFFFPRRGAFPHGGFSP